MSNEADVLIKKKEAELASLRQHMADLKTEFIVETINFASEWYKKQQAMNRGDSI